MPEEEEEEEDLEQEVVEDGLVEVVAVVHLPEEDGSAEALPEIQHHHHLILNSNGDLHHQSQDQDHQHLFQDQTHLIMEQVGQILVEEALSTQEATHSAQIHMELSNIQAGALLEMQ